MKSPERSSPSPRYGVTLLESLTVIMILSIILAFAAPTMLDIIRATRMSTAGEFMTGKLAEAQGLALAFSSDVELRFYKSSASQTGASVSGQFVQLYQWVESDPDADAAITTEVAKLEKIGNREPIPEGVAISEHPDFSSLWNLRSETEESVEGTREYVAIRFRPDGSTDLPENVSWHLTLVEHPTPILNSLPPNFYTVQIDPVTAKLDIYRPE